ncbi:hypothetical protein FB451DRAFT_1215202 [Mycena latifolia]|nr:hypothetical protein FB451DRAFT_1215202 [Mycena latifolia]
MASDSQPTPTALVVPIIEAYTHGIRPALAFALIATAFGSMLFPLLILLFSLSTTHTRRKPIFILNVLSVCLGIIASVLTIHRSTSSVLSPFASVNVTENLVYLTICELTPWFAEAVLLVRVAVVFSRQRLPLLLAFPITLKIARVVASVIFCIRWAKMEFSGMNTLPRWLFQVPYSLELIDNSYVSFLFLWRLQLSRQSRFIEGTAVGPVNLSNSTQSFASKLQTLFWIAATNFIFPLIFGLIEIITACRARDIKVTQLISQVNAYIAIISTVFATVWSSTSSLKGAMALNNAVVSQPLVFCTMRTTETILSIPPAHSAGEHSQNEKESK